MSAGPARRIATAAVWAALARAAVAVVTTAGTAAAQPDPAAIDWVRLDGFSIARTETTVAQFRRHADATGAVTRAERQGGGQVYEAGWTTKPGWSWRRPFGEAPALDDEPAVHIGFDEAQAFCQWSGGRLPTDAQWLQAAYTEQRAAPPAPFSRGTRYPYPTGDQPDGAQCLQDCGAAAAARARRPAARLWRGDGPARVTQTPAGVNGLHDMGGNVWEWVDEPPGPTGPSDRSQRRTRGGSWWYGAAQMRADHLQAKPADTAVVYIGFRCVRDR